MKKTTILAAMMGMAGMAAMMGTTPNLAKGDKYGQQVSEQTTGTRSETSDTTASNEVSPQAVIHRSYYEGNVYAVRNSNYTKWCNSVGSNGVNKIKRTKRLKRKHRR